MGDVIAGFDASVSTERGKHEEPIGRENMRVFVPPVLGKDGEQEVLESCHFRVVRTLERLAEPPGEHSLLVFNLHGDLAELVEAGVDEEGDEIHSRPYVRFLGRFAAEGVKQVRRRNLSPARFVSEIKPEVIY